MELQRPSDAKTLELPLGIEQIRDLELGNIVYLDGVVFTCRTVLQKEILESERIPPPDLQRTNVMFHTGPVMMADLRGGDGWKPLCIAGTASMRFEEYTPHIIEKLRLRAIVGKGTMGSSSMEAMRQFGCVHLCSVGVYGKALATKVKRVIAVHGLVDMGMIEATWILEVEDFGPFIVDIDAQGNNLFHQLNLTVAANARAVYGHFGLKGPAEGSWYQQKESL